MDKKTILNIYKTCLFKPMSTESLNRTSAIVGTPARVNVDVLKQRLIEQKRKDIIKRTVIFSTVCVSLGVLTILTY